MEELNSHQHLLSNTLDDFELEAVVLVLFDKLVQALSEGLEHHAGVGNHASRLVIVVVGLISRVVDEALIEFHEVESVSSFLSDILKNFDLDISALVVPFDRSYDLYSKILFFSSLRTKERSPKSTISQVLDHSVPRSDRFSNSILVVTSIVVPKERAASTRIIVA